jgi:hypothetical protein
MIDPLPSETGAIDEALHYPPPHTPLSMVTDDERLGTCPNCGHGIDPRDELISYERSDSTLGVFAECPGCERVVSPK